MCELIEDFNLKKKKIFLLTVNVINSVMINKSVWEDIRGFIFHIRPFGAILKKTIIREVIEII